MSAVPQPLSAALAYAAEARRVLELGELIHAEDLRMKLELRDWFRVQRLRSSDEPAVCNPCLYTIQIPLLPAYHTRPDA
jgi:hypothetical protein